MIQRCCLNWRLIWLSEIGRKRGIVMADHLLKLPIGVQDFPTLRVEGFVYVDKTKYLYDLITNNRVYFLSRPRRFGKSLLISTLEAIFQGKKELFKDLWIDSSDYDWKVYPVIRIDMSRTVRTDPESLDSSLIDLVKVTAEHYQIDLGTPLNSGQALDKLIRLLGERGEKAVVLIDEYDKPLLDNIDDVELTKKMRTVLRQFYAILKAQDGNLKFVLLTGVTKFSKVSVFSDLNNLQDLTLDRAYGTLLGYTQEELEQVFAPWIKRLAENSEHTVDEELIKIKRWYNGYQFSSKNEKVYNPFSTLLLFQQQEYRAHWFATGTPTFLLKLIEDQQFDITQIDDIRVQESAFSSYDIDKLDIFSLLYQAGYLTIKQFDGRRNIYMFGYPNLEVEEGFTESLLEYFTKLSRAYQDTTVFKLVDYINAKDYKSFFDELKIFLSKISYDLHMMSEKYYQNIVYFIFTLMGVELQIEVHTHFGRIDAVIEFDDRILIFEFKLDQSADVALKQIHEKKYAEKYQGLGKDIQLFGVEFSTKERNIVEWKLEELKVKN